jgi:hypothetical protein
MKKKWQFKNPRYVSPLSPFSLRVDEAEVIRSEKEKNRGQRREMEEREAARVFFCETSLSECHRNKINFIPKLIFAQQIILKYF